MTTQHVTVTTKLNRPPVHFRQHCPPQHTASKLVHVRMQVRYRLHFQLDLVGGEEAAIDGRRQRRNGCSHGKVTALGLDKKIARNTCKDKTHEGTLSCAMSVSAPKWDDESPTRT